ncbi:MUC3B protein, partial [Podargus strigoides]|nr:MUC3B protein [Podargus strigoides]
PPLPDPCQNGGRWTGLGCQCPPNVEGDLCQFGAPTINLTAELGPSLMMSSRVTNRNYSEEMTDASSAAYRNFTEEFRRTMDEIYRNVSGYRGIRILSLSPGSVVVTYEILLNPSAGVTSSPAHRDLLAMAARNCSQSAGGFQATNHSSALVTKGQGSSSSPELCRKSTLAVFSRFYFPLLTPKGLLCVTNCTPNHPGTFQCHSG